MKKLMNLLVLLFVTQAMFAQESTIDPRATVLLDKMNAQFDSYEAYEMDFKIVLQFPEMDKPDVQRGKFIRKDAFYRVITPEQKIYCNGTYVWMYTRSGNEVQITDADDTGSDFVSPDQLFTLYKTGDYIYRINREFDEKGEKLAEIEFKPTDKMSDYFKIKMILNRTTHLPKSIKIFYKDGLRVTTKVTNIIKNKNYKVGFFDFDAIKFPGVKVEDLRL